MIRPPLSTWTLRIGRSLRWRSTSQQAFALAWPIVLASIGENIISLLDTAFMGRVGVVELGAVGLATIWYFMLLIVSMGLGAGLQILVARRLGEGQPQAVGRSFDQGLLVGLAVAGLLYGVQWGLGAQLYRLFCESDAVYAASLTYLDWRSWDIFFAVQIFLLRGFYNGIGENRIVVWSTALMAALNALLNYVLVFGAWGAPALGIAGVAIASGVAHVTAWAVLWINLFARRLPTRFGLLRTFRPDWATARSLLQLSAPLILQYVISMVAFFFFMGLIEKRGETALAVSNLMKSVYLTFMIPSWGLSSAVGTLVSRRIGEGHANAVLPLMWHVARLNLLLALVLSTPLVVVPQAVLFLFTDDAAVVEAALPLVVVVVPALWVYALSNILLGALIGTGASRWSMATELLNAALYIGFLVIAAALGGSLQVLWMCEWIYVLVIGLLPGWLLHSGRWRGIVV